MKNFEEELYTTTELTQIFKVSLQTIHNWIREGKLPAFQVGRKWYVTSSTIKKLMEKNINQQKRDH